MRQMTGSSVLERVKDSEEERCRQAVMVSLEMAGLKEKLNPNVIDRLVLLERYSKFNSDSRLIARGVDNVFGKLAEHYRDKDPAIIISESDRENARLSAILHDVGKAGDADASPAEQRAVIDLFALEKIKNPQDLVGKVVRENFDSVRAEEMLKLLASCGVAEGITMREFWDKHAYWTHNVLKRYPEGTSERIRTIAASHHIDRGINPCNLPLGEVPPEAVSIGTLEEYIELLQHRALIATDKYEAFIRRSGGNHEEAMKVLRELVKPQFKEDALMNQVLEIIDELGREEKIFN